MRLVACSSFAAVVLAMSAGAQVPDFTFTRVADGVYTTVRHTAVQSPADGNATAIITDRDVIIVDASLTASSARAVLRELRKVTAKPVRYVIATHWHDDHVLGAQVWLAAFPGATFVAHTATRDSIVSEVIPSMVTNLSTTYPATVRDLTARLASGVNRDGTPLGAADSARLRQSIATYDYFMRESRGVRIAVPTLTTDNGFTLHRGEHEIQVRYLGLGNTNGDLVVHLPRQRVAITGDLVVAPTPFAYGSHLIEWRATLRALRALAGDSAVIIPGHGAPQRDWRYVDMLDELFASVTRQADSAVRRGLDLDATRKAIDLSALRQRFTGGDPRLERGFDVNFTAPAVERAFLAAGGKIPPK